MIGTNRDLRAVQELLDVEILHFHIMLKTAPEQDWIKYRLHSLSRQRASVCLALVNRRAEAAKKVVAFSRWVSGNGALESGGVGAGAGATQASAGWRKRTSSSG